MCCCCSLSAKRKEQERAEDKMVPVLDSVYDQCFNTQRAASTCTVRVLHAFYRTPYEHSKPTWPHPQRVRSKRVSDARKFAWTGPFQQTPARLNFLVKLNLHRPSKLIDLHGQP